MTPIDWEDRFESLFRDVNQEPPEIWRSQVNRFVRDGVNPTQVFLSEMKERWEAEASTNA